MLTVKSFQFSPIEVNTYLLYNQLNECIIIDPGCYSDAEKDILNTFIYEKKLTPKLLLNTHCHLDHVFGNKMVAEKYNLKPQMHLNEKEVLAFAPTSGLMYNLPFDNYTGPCTYLSAHDKISIGNDELTVLFTPGHSPGSLSFYSPQYNFVISGDVLFKNSIGRTDLPGGNHTTLIKSIVNNLLTLPQHTIVHSGHGVDTTIGYESANNPYLQ